MIFYDPAEGHGLPHDPFKALVAPRPIGWISSLDAEGRPNLAPYSFFNGISGRPPMVLFSSEGRKDSVNNIEKTGAFVCNIATWDLREEMNKSSAPAAPGVSEFELAGLEMAPGRAVDVPRVARCAAALECRYVETVVVKDIDGKPVDSFVVIGQVVGVHIDERVLKDGLVDMSKLRLISRLGYMDYAVIDEVFQMVRPTTA